MIAAVVPAAGKSERMGRPKLLIEVGGQPLIVRVVSALKEGGVGRVVVVAPPPDAPESAPLVALAEKAGGEVVVPAVRPTHMRGSIELGLDRLAQSGPPDRVVITPGDFPALSGSLVKTLLDRARERPGRIVMPRCQGRRGHPVVMPWSIAWTLRELPTHLGPNALAARHADLVDLVEVADGRVALDLDTPADLTHWNDAATSGGPVIHRVRLFAAARALAGAGEISVELPPGATVADLRRALGLVEPRLAPLAAVAMIAVDEEYAPEGMSLTPPARLALIPPVSGGSSIQTGPGSFVLERRFDP